MTKHEPCMRKQLCNIQLIVTKTKISTSHNVHEYITYDIRKGRGRATLPGRDPVGVYTVKAFYPTRLGNLQQLETSG